MIQLLSILSGITAILVYYIYYKQVKSNSSTPNPSSWAIWALVMIINAFTYQEVLQDNPIKGLLAYVTVLCVVIMFSYSLKQGKFTKPNMLDIVIFCIAIAIGFFWKTTGNAFISQIALQTILFISFIPTITGLLSGKAKEEAKPWLIAVLAYMFSIASILWEWNGNWIELAFPIVNGILGNGIVGLIALSKNKTTLSTNL